MPGWKSLLDIDRLLEAWQFPDTAAPQRMTLLKHVADLAAAIDPAAREGDGNAIPVVVPDPQRKPQAMPMTWIGQKDEGRDGREAASAEIPPPPDTGAKGATPEEIAEIRESAMTGKDWQAEARSTATAKIMPEGRLTVEVGAVTPRQGPILPPGSVRVSGEDMPPDDMLATLHKIAPHIDEYTDQERKAATAMAYRLERLKERDPKGFAKLPDELQNFLGDYKGQMDVERTPIGPKKLKDKTAEITAEEWEGMTDRSAEHALKRAVRSQAFAAPAGRSAESLAEFASGLNDLFLHHHDVVAEHIETLRQWGENRRKIPPEYRTDKVLKAVDALDRIRRFFCP